MINQERFDLALRCAIEKLPTNQIGTLSEKTLHRVLKYFFEPNDEFHEVECYGSVADIKGENGIIEIQTRSFDKMLPKLERFLPSERVNIVYPIVENKTICLIDSCSGEAVSQRKSPKKGRAWDALFEISAIRNFIPHENLTVTLVFVDAVETRLNGETKKVGRKKTSKLDCIPTSINRVVEMKNTNDFFVLLPDKLPAEFSAYDFGKITGARAIKLHNSLKFLMSLGILTREKGDGRAYIYTRK